MLLSEFLDNSARRYAGKEALVCEDRRVSYGELAEEADRLANALRKRIGKQDRVAVFLENSPEAVIAIFAIAKAGAVFVVINPQVKARRLEYILNDCQVRVLISDTKHLYAAGDSIGNCPRLDAVILTDHEPGSFSLPLVRPAVLSYRAVLQESSSACPPPALIDVDLASLIYTSGSTGNPKGVMLTHFNMVSAANSITQYLQNTPDDIILSCLPLAFDYGLYQALMAVKFGGTLVLEKAFTYPYKIVDTLIRENVTGFPLVPTMAIILLQMKNLAKYDFSRLRYITNTAQALAPRHILQMRRIFPHVRIYSMYGLTECKRESPKPPMRESWPIASWRLMSMKWSM
jgi:acyl-CoA synthetase (AMP-forming)/AMP-acid ligase II